MHLELMSGELILYQCQLNEKSESGERDTSTNTLATSGN